MSKNNNEGAGHSRERKVTAIKGVSPQMPEKKAPRILGVEPHKRKRAVPPDLQIAASGTGSVADFIYNGGPIINTPQVYAIFLGDWSSAANQTRATRLGQFIQDLLNSQYMNILSQYGCGSTGTLANSVFIASSDHDLSGADINNILQTAINGNQIPEPTNSSICYVLFLDDATAVNDELNGAVMCEPTSDTAFGFHWFFTTTAGNLCAYSVIPGLNDACLTNSCPSDSGCSLHLAQTQEQRQTQVTSHELAEMFSDPRFPDGWISQTQSENGDICNGQSGTITVGLNTWTVQLMYSKWDDMNSNGSSTCVLSPPNPLPSLLPACTVSLDRSTFGKDEVDALLHISNPNSIDSAFYVYADGFTPNDLGITSADLTGSPSVFPTIVLSPPEGGISVTPTSLIAEDSSLGGGMQRFTWTYKVNFTSSNDFPAAVGGTKAVTLSATVTRITAPTLSASGSAIVQLIHEPNPYETDGPVSWLSTDLRVFQIRAGESKFGTVMGTSANDASTFIKTVIDNLNTGGSATGGDSFEGLSTDENTSALELSEMVDGTQVFNFAIAKVRYRALANPAPKVRVFFRLFPALATSVDYNQSTTYARGGVGGVTIPLLGVVGGSLVTIPFFAEARKDTTVDNMDAQQDPKNVQDIPFNSTGQEVNAYFGCWLDINQTTPRFPINPSSAHGPFSVDLKTIQELIRDAHQCLIAEIAFDPDPISSGATPGSSDKLAQRNLSIVASGNPGSPGSRLIPNTFEVRWSPDKLPPTVMVDELLIDWSHLPSGSEAELYVPGISAAKIIELADEMYISHRFQLVDDATIKLPAQGFSYLPVPIGAGANLPGLLTVNLPPNVVKGQAFKVIVRQLTNAQGRAKPAPPPKGPKKDKDIEPAAQAFKLIKWRKIVGSYQISIPVLSESILLVPEERLLSVLRWILKAIPSSDRWFKVFTRYVDQVADRVKALGGDPDLIQPSPSGEWQGPKELELCVTGKVCEVIYDCFGEFEGFIIKNCKNNRNILKSREHQIGKLMMKACKERLLVSVCYYKSRPDRIEKIVFHC